MKKIIYDLGASVGENLPYLLIKSDLVIAVEANKESCEKIKENFKEQINQKKLIVENCIVGENDKKNEVFFIHKYDYLLSQFPEPQHNLKINFKQVNLEKKDILSLIRKYGAPYYIKIDLEQYDDVILKRIFDFNILPNYISAEAINQNVIDQFIKNENYKSFKINEGKNIDFLYKKTNLFINNKKIKFSFPKNSSGPFGNDILGKWMNKRNYIKFMYYKKEGWRDIHASLVDQPENIDNVNKYIDFDRKLEKKAKFIKRLMRFKSKFKFF